MEPGFSNILILLFTSVVSTTYHGQVDNDVASGSQQLPTGEDYDWIFTISLKSKPLLCVDLPGGQATNANPLEIWECNGMENQLWFFTAGTYEIRYGGDPSKCLDAGDMQEGTTLKLWDCNGLDQQKWGYDPQAMTIYLAKSATEKSRSNLTYHPAASSCMDLRGGGVSGGTAIEVWSCNGLWQQQWVLQAGVTIRVGQNYKLCLDLAGGKTDNGTPVQIWACNGLPNQFWIWEDGGYNIKFAGDASKCIDAGNMQSGTQLMLWDCNGLPQQKFGYDPRMATIWLASKQMNADKCVDLPGGSLSQGSRPQIWDCNGCWNQDFLVNGPVSKPKASIQASATGPLRPGSWGGQGCPALPGPPAPPGPGPSPMQPIMPSCEPGDQHGWPRFDSQAQLSGDAQWSKYFMTVYGAVPTGGYPICVFNFHVLYPDALHSAGIARTPKSHPSAIGDYYRGAEYGAQLNMIYHGRGNFQPFSSNVWVEAVHCRAGGETAGAWYYYMPGSGIWVYTGSTKAYQDRQESWRDILGVSSCSDFQCGGKLFTTAKKKFGYDSIQYLAEGGDKFMFILTEGVGRNTCGAAATTWKAGWAATQSCNCDQSQKCQNCKGFALSQNSSSGSHPCSPMVV